MKLIHIKQFTKSTSDSSLKSEIFEIEVPIEFEFNKILVLDELYHMVKWTYNKETSQLVFDLTDFPDMLSKHFESQVNKNGLYVLFYNDCESDFRASVSYLIDQFLPNRLPLIESWLQKSKVLEEGESTNVEEKEMQLIKDNLSEKEYVELKGIFLIEEEFNLIENKKGPFCISIHAKSDLDYDDIKKDDLYTKLHDTPIAFPFIMISDGIPYTMPEFKYSYELPYPTKSLFLKFVFTEKEQELYSIFYELFNRYVSEHFQIAEEECSKIGGYFQQDIEYSESNENDYFNVDKWILFLNLSSYSHHSDFFNDIGDGNVDVLLRKDEGQNYEKLESKILVSYT